MAYLIYRNEYLHLCQGANPCIAMYLHQSTEHSDGQTYYQDLFEDTARLLDSVSNVISGVIFVNILCVL